MEIKREIHGISSFKYKDWSGKSRSKTKRGFATKKEAQNWENQFKLRESHELI
ncbi:Arm DNA-binding domain-containing protein [Streptococcus equi subsp. zooepidemicus]|nr:Arm DNA-binding domain-containing protein [Streptococcus equi subsp. zooepidemicus]